MSSRRRGRRVFVVLSVLAAAGLGAGSALLGMCGPFTDVSDAGFCPFVLEIFTLGITTGTSATTYDPGSNVTRLQMAAFLSRTVDGVLKRGSKRAALRQYWTVQNGMILPTTTTLPGQPMFVEYDGADLWVSASTFVSRLRASDGKLLETWTGVSDIADGVLIAMGKVFVVAFGQTTGLSGRLYRIDPSLPAGAATTVASNLPQFSTEIAFDGGRIWSAGGDGTVSIVTPGATLPWSVSTTAGGYQSPIGILYDGTNIWITDLIGQTLLKLSGSGGVLQTVTVGANPLYPVFDGSNIWVPNQNDSSVSVVRASTGAVLATLTGNGLIFPFSTAFDGQRVLVTGSGGVSLWKAADLTPLGSFPMPSGFSARAATSDGVSFWITLEANMSPFLGKVARF